MPIFVKAHRKKGGSFVRGHVKAGKAGAKGASVLKELKLLRGRQGKAIPDSVRLLEGRRIKQLEKALNRKKALAGQFRINFRARGRIGTVSERILDRLLAEY